MSEFYMTFSENFMTLADTTQPIYLVVSNSASLTETPITIKSKNESNPDTNALTDSLLADIQSNKSASHSHTNKAVLDSVTAPFTTSIEAKLAGIEQNAKDDMSPAEIVAAVDTSLGNTNWKTGVIIPGVNYDILMSNGAGSAVISSITANASKGINHSSSGSMYDSIDNTKILKQDLSQVPSNTTVTVTQPSFPFNFNSYFRTDGNVIKFQKNVSIENYQNNTLSIFLGGSIYYHFKSSTRFQLYSTTQIAWGPAYADGAVDTMMDRRTPGMVGFNGSLVLDGIKIGTLASKPVGMLANEIWADTTDSAVDPILRLTTAVT